MMQNVLSRLGGVAGYGIISILLFFVFFTGMLVWAMRLKRPYLDRMGSKALEEGAVVDPATGAGVGADGQRADRKL